MPSIEREIYRGFKFTVTMLAPGASFFTQAGFQKVSGLKTSVEVVEYREGNNPDRMEKLIGMLSFDTVTLERGVSNDDDFNNWMKAVAADTLQSADVNGVPPGTALDSEVRRDILISLHDKKGKVVKTYKLLKAFPSEYTVGDFDATSNDVVISSLVLQHHGIVETNLAS
jgi:phage tail-like protein